MSFQVPAPAAPWGAGAAADREILVTVGINLNRLLQISGIAPLEGPAAMRPDKTAPGSGRPDELRSVASTGAGSPRTPASARTYRVRITSLDPGADWVLTGIGVDRRVLLADLSVTFPRQSAARCCGRAATRRSIQAPRSRPALPAPDRPDGDRWRRRRRAHRKLRPSREPGRGCPDPVRCAHPLLSAKIRSIGQAAGRGRYHACRAGSWALYLGSSFRVSCQGPGPCRVTVQASRREAR